MIVKLLTTAVSLFGATILFWAGVAWEHRPPGFASWDVPIWGPLHFRHADPGGPFAQLGALRAREAAAARRAGRIERDQADASSRIADQDLAAQVRIRTVTRTLVQEVPIAMPPSVDRAFPLSVGFVRLHDAAARGLDLSDIAAPAGAPDSAAAGVAASDAAGAIAANYGDCRADAQELADWQRWYAALTAAQNAR
jgi:hypothetical protein